MISHLASLADQRLIISFAPKTPYYSLLKRIGELFPGPSKVGRAGQRGVVCGFQERVEAVHAAAEQRWVLTCCWH